MAESTYKFPLLRKVSRNTVTTCSSLSPVATHRYTTNEQRLQRIFNTSSKGASLNNEKVQEVDGESSSSHRSICVWRRGQACSG